MLRPMIATLVLAGLAAPTLAQETKASVAAKYKAEFAATDTDKNRSLSMAEVTARMANMKTAKGSLDPTHAKRLASLWFARADANKDGKVTEKEGQALLAATFDKYDANGDGRVGTDERATAKADVKAER